MLITKGSLLASDVKSDEPDFDLLPDFTISAKL